MKRVIKQVPVRLELDLFRKLKKDSYENERSMNLIINELLEEKYNK